MLFEQIIKAFIVGVLASIPVGPVALLVIRNSLGKGHGSGFVTGLGACFVDTVFTIIAVFFLAFAQDFIKDNEVIISLVGGAIVTCLGVSMAFSNPFRRLEKREVTQEPSVKDFLQAVLLGITNPGGILVIIALFAFVGLGNIPTGDWRIAPIILAVCAGSATYWFYITQVLCKFKHKLDIDKLIWINRITGIAISILGIIFVGDALFKILFQGAKLF